MEYDKDLYFWKNKIKKNDYYNQNEVSIRKSKNPSNKLGN